MPKRWGGLPFYRLPGEVKNIDDIDRVKQQQTKNISYHVPVTEITLARHPSAELNVST